MRWRGTEFFTPGDVAGGGVKSASAVGPEEVAEMVAEVGWEGDIKSIFVVMVGPQALLQPRRFIKYRATQFEGWGVEGKELLPLCSIAIYSLLHTRTGFEKESDHCYVHGMVMNSLMSVLYSAES
jgi:hypothetical protein